MSTYAEKLRDPRWQRRRLEIMQRDEFACRDCGSTSEMLNVHHSLYRKGADPWDYADDELSTLCRACHKFRHQEIERLMRVVGRLHGQAFVQVLTGAAMALLPKDQKNRMAMGRGELSGFCAMVAAKACWDRWYPKFKEIEEAIEVGRNLHGHKHVHANTVADEIVSVLQCVAVVES
jgi:hypothetical protein